MSGFLRDLGAQALGVTDSVMPARAPLFAPEAGTEVLQAISRDAEGAPVSGGSIAPLSHGSAAGAQMRLGARPAAAGPDSLAAASAAEVTGAWHAGRAGTVGPVEPAGPDRSRPADEGDSPNHVRTAVSAAPATTVASTLRAPERMTVADSRLPRMAPLASSGELPRQADPPRRRAGELREDGAGRSGALPSPRDVASSERTSGDAAPVVRIHIGRIEIRAATPAPATAPKPPAQPAGPVQRRSLEDYLSIPRGTRR